MKTENTDGQTVYIVDDDPLARDLLFAQLQSENINAYTYESGPAFLDALEPEPRGCLLLDFQMPGMSGKDLQLLLASRGVGLPIIFLTGTGDVETAAAVMKHGAVDVIVKPWRQAQLVESVREALRLEQTRWEKTVWLDELQRRLADLTPRELEIGDLVVQGRSNKTIATMLDISERTVEVHRSRVMSKMQAEGLARLVVLWREAMDDLLNRPDGRAAGRKTQ